MTGNLVDLLHDFMTTMFEGYNGDKPFQYTEIKTVATEIYKKEEITLFGWLESRNFDRNKKEIESLSKEEIKKKQADIKEHK